MFLHKINKKMAIFTFFPEKNWVNWHQKKVTEKEKN